MADDLEQRIERALELLKFIWEGPFIHGVICDMKREREQMQEQRDVAIRHIAEWCAAIHAHGGDWDEWDQYYKDARFNHHALPEIRALLNQAIEIETATKECQT